MLASLESATAQVIAPKAMSLLDESLAISGEPGMRSLMVRVLSWREIPGQPANPFLSDGPMQAVWTLARETLKEADG